MNHKKFWSKYLKQNPIDIYDDAIDFFSQEMTDDFMQNYDYVEVMIEFQSALEDAKEYEKLIKFVDIIRRNQPIIYQESFSYLNISLVTYYLFKEEPEKAWASFYPCTQNPDEGYDIYFDLIKTFLFFQQDDIISEAKIRNIYEIMERDRISPGYKSDLVGLIFHRELEKYYANQQFNRDELIAMMDNYDYEISDELLEKLDLFYSVSYDKENIWKLGKSKDKKDLFLIEFLFLEYMKNKGFSFSHSGLLWYGLVEYFSINSPNKNVQHGNLFQITYKSFTNYLRDRVDIWLKTTNQCFNIIWGVVYFYDFLQSYKIISEHEYQAAISVIKKVKEKFKSENKPDLWEYTFIHSWQKPDSISEEEFLVEKKYFRDTFSIVIQYPNSNLLPDNYDDYLDEVWDVNWDEDLNNDKIEPPEDRHNYIHNEGNPIKVKKTPGRNDPCPCGSGKKFKKCCGR